MNVSERGLDLIRQYEGCRLKAYRDIVGVLTIGYGSTGAHVQEGMEITPEEADRLLREDIQHAERCVTRLLAGLAVTQGQYDAMVSFAFNCGCDALRRSSVLRLLVAGDDNGAAEAFGLWCKAGGKVVAGLTRRRAAEAELFRGMA